MSSDPVEESEFLSGFRERRLSSYRSTPEDINAHYSDEGQIQADYHRRFAFELIQNADDAMSSAVICWRVINQTSYAPNINPTTSRRRP